MRPQSTPLQPFLFPMKWCAACQTYQPLCFFGRQRRYKDGLEYTCKACKKQHNARRLTKRPRRVEPMGMKWCPGCERLRSLRQFWRDRQSADGFLSECKECARKRNRARYVAHRDEEIAKCIAWQKAHPERMWEINRRRRLKRRPVRTAEQNETRRQRAAERAALRAEARALRRQQKETERQQHKLALRAQRETQKQQTRARRRERAAQWKAQHRERVRAQERLRYAKNPAKYHASARRWEQKNREKMRAIRGMHGARRRMWVRERKVGIVDYAAIWTRDGGRCHICGLPVVRGEEQYDHIWPLARGGAHREDNIAVAHKHCNLSKGAKIDVRSEQI